MDAHQQSRGSGQMDESQSTRGIHSAIPTTGVLISVLLVTLLTPVGVLFMKGVNGALGIVTSLYPEGKNRH